MKEVLDTRAQPEIHSHRAALVREMLLAAAGDIYLKEIKLELSSR